MMGKALARLGALTVVVAGLAYAGTALASGDRVTVSVPKRVHPNTDYNVTARGFAPGRTRLYVFIDVLKCAPDPNAEHYAHHARDKHVVVRGSFKKVSGWIWSSSHTVHDHVCAYLQAPYWPLYSPHGVLARASRSYYIH